MLARTLPPIKLTPTAHWNSFEQFRTSGANALTNITSGTVGTLHTKSGQYRILTEEDFQHLLGIATDAERLQQGLNVVTRAVRVVQNHPQDSETLALLAETVAMLGTMSTVLPTISSFPPLVLEDIAVDPEDKVILSSEEIQRPLTELSNYNKAIR